MMREAAGLDEIEAQDAPRLRMRTRSKRARNHRCRRFSRYTTMESRWFSGFLLPPYVARATIVDNEPRARSGRSCQASASRPRATNEPLNAPRTASLTLGRAETNHESNHGEVQVKFPFQGICRFRGSRSCAPARARRFVRPCYCERARSLVRPLHRAHARTCSLRGSHHAPRGVAAGDRGHAGESRRGRHQG